MRTLFAIIIALGLGLPLSADQAAAPAKDNTAAAAPAKPLKKHVKKTKKHHKKASKKAAAKPVSETPAKQ
jgi:hypothetical protein